MSAPTGTRAGAAPRVAVIDNYDSFVYNLVQYLAQIGADVEVWRNDDPRFADPAFATGFDGILLSPGPGTPEEAGICVDVVRSQGGRVPIFGVCLGLQSIGVAYGGVVDRAPELGPLPAERPPALVVVPRADAGEQAALVDRLVTLALARGTGLR